MAWERFTRPRGSFSPRVTVRRTGQLGFSQGTIRRFELGRFSHCILYYDPQAKRIAVQPVENPSEPGAVKMTIRESDGFVSARSFLAYYDISYDASRSYEARWDAEMGAVIVDLTKPLTRRARDDIGEGEELI